MGLEINRRVFLSTGAAGPLALTRLSPQQPPLDVGNRAQLLLDDHLVERKRGIRLRVTPARADHIRLVSPDSPADRNGVWAWVSVAQEGGRVRMWYNGCALGDPREVSRLCYAESDDGAHWDKPACGVTSFQGSKKNNIAHSSPSRMREACSWTRRRLRENATSASSGNAISNGGTDTG